ncbi:MAG: polysaccharide deacetylase family protein [Armatimonadetes bacterium]|nr:polysaccharide deacetylase family protein [Armatimonadota bacterium]
MIFWNKLAVFIVFLAAVITGVAAPARAALPAPDRLYLERLATALQELESGSCVSAHQALVAALEQRRDERLAYLVRPVIYLHCGAFAEADKAFDEAIKMNAPGDICAYGKAVCSLARRDFGAARSRLPSSGKWVQTEDLQALSAYIDVLRGGGPDRVRNEPAFVQMAAYASLRAGDLPKAEALLSSVKRRTEPVAALDSGLGFSMDPAAPVHYVSLSNAASEILGQVQAGPLTGFSGVVRLRADRSKTPGAEYVQFMVDDSVIGIVNAPPYEISWDTSRVANGVHTVTMRSQTGAGYVLGETSQQVMVTNVAPSPGAPITGPAADRLIQALWELLRLGPCHTWNEYELGRIAEQSGRSREAMLHYERVLASEPFYRDAGSRWKSLTRFSALETVWKGKGTDHSIAVTFDDGPNDGTESLLEAVSASGVRATFFIVGSQARRYPDLLKKIAAGGHELACHSESHRSMTQLNTEEFIRELFGPISIIHELTGQIPRFFRPPGGHLNAVARRTAAEFGLTPVMWTTHVGPYEGGPVATMEQYAAAKVQAGSVLLLHNCEPTTLKAFPAMIANFRSRNLKMVGISDLRK